MLNKKIFRKCLEFWENEKLNIIYLERARKSLSFFVAKIKERRKMSDNIEIDMDEEDVKLFNAAFLGLGIVGVIIVALVAFQPDGYQRFLNFIELNSENFRKFSNIIHEIISFMN